MLVTHSNALKLAEDIIQQRLFSQNENRPIIILYEDKPEVTLRRSVSHCIPYYTLFIRHVEILKMDQKYGILIASELGNIIFNKMIEELESHVSGLVEAVIHNLDRGCVRDVYFGSSVFVSIHTHTVPYMNEPLRYIEIQHNNKICYYSEYDFNNQESLKENLASIFKAQISSGERPVSIPESL